MSNEREEMGKARQGGNVQGQNPHLRVLARCLAGLPVPLGPVLWPVKLKL